MAKDSIGSLLAQDDEKGVEQAVHSLSRAFTNIE